MSGTEYVVYHVSESGAPSAHDTSHGEWFFQPSDVNDGEVFSDGYKTREEAEQAAQNWAYQECGQ